MTVLVLDWDETFVARKDSIISDAQVLELSEETGIYQHGTNKSEFKLMMVKKMAALIEEAVINYNGIMFLTAGKWNEFVLKEAARIISPFFDDTVRAKVTEAFLNCRFHSAVTDALLFNEDEDVVAEMDKCTRLKKIAEQEPDEYWVILDNSLAHVDSFADEPNMIAILAPTTTDYMNYCDDAFEMLAVADYQQEKALKAKAEALKPITKEPAVSIRFQEAISDSDEYKDENNENAAPQIATFDRPVRKPLGELQLSGYGSFFHQQSNSVKTPEVFGKDVDFDVEPDPEEGDENRAPDVENDGYYHFQYSD